MPTPLLVSRATVSTDSCTFGSRGAGCSHQSGSVRDMARRWTAELELSWHPILTFERRRLALMDWLEENVDVVAFKNTAEQVGVSTKSTELRATATSSGLKLSSSSPLFQLDQLAGVVAGVLEVFSPAEPRLKVSRSTWSAELPGSYALACARFGRHVSFYAETGEFAATDGSALVDLDGSSAHIQMEIGVVEAQELLMRLSVPQVSRIPQSSSSARTRVSPQGITISELPSLSLFGEIVWVPKGKQLVAQTDDVSTATYSILEQCASILDSVALSLSKPEGGDR